MKHTPGPWEFVTDRGDRKIVAPTTDANNRTRETLMCDTAYYPWCPDLDADWRLIAAAPDLLEVLLEILADGMHCDVSPVLQRKARAAIAKATGEKEKR